ncbi:MAG: histidine kinase dimerization/phosphoacceptor domain -containing protein [Treponemataceae bacterium]
MRMPEAKFSTYFFLAILIPTLASLLIGVVFGSALYRNFRLDNQKRQLTLTGSYIVAMIAENPLGLSDPALPRFLRTFSLIDDRRITIIRSDGSVLADSTIDDVASMANHGEREEVRVALSGRIGMSSRRSKTTGIEYLYVAQPFRQKEVIVAVVRVAKETMLIQSERQMISRGMTGIGIAYLLLTLLVGYTISAIFGKFVRRMSGVAEQMANGRFDLRMKSAHITELKVLSESLNRMADRIGQNMEELVGEKKALESARDRLSTTVDLKETYLKELQHRVKNNLNVISSIMNLELGRLADGDAKRVFKEMITRVETVSRIYESLYKSSDLETVDLQPYLQGLADSIQSAYNDEQDHITIETDIESVRVDSKKAMPLGLILNECLTNAFKYAFQSQENGFVHVRLNVLEREIVLTISDNGVGFRPGFRAESSTSLGLQIVHLLAEQLGGRISINGTKGVTVTLSIDK